MRIKASNNMFSFEFPIELGDFFFDNDWFHDFFASVWEMMMSRYSEFILLRVRFFETLTWVKVRGVCAGGCFNPQHQHKGRALYFETWRPYRSEKHWFKFSVSYDNKKNLFPFSPFCAKEKFTARMSWDSCRKKLERNVPAPATLFLESSRKMSLFSLD